MEKVETRTSTRFFFMLCSKNTERECLEKKLFGMPADSSRKYKAVEPGDWGFLFNYETGHLIGVFEAISRPQLNIDPEAWNGRFPLQVRVKVRFGPRHLERGAQILVQLGLMRADRKAPSFPVHDNPELLSTILVYFGIDPSRVFPRAEQTVQFPRFHVPTKVRFDDVAGLDDVKTFIRERMVEPALDPELADRYRLRVGGGLLLFGPPGTGKTHLAHAAAGELDAWYEEISPSVIRGYPGEAEKAIENLFYQLFQKPRAVLFIDEAEALLAAREKQTSSVMQRVTPVFLRQFSLLRRHNDRPLLIIAATNAPWDIDPAFLRPGRLDRAFFIGLPDRRARVALLKIALRSRPIEQALDDEATLEVLADALDGFSGADIEQIIDQVAFEAFRQAKRSGNHVLIKAGDILTVAASWPKSVAKESLDKYEEWARKMGIRGGY